MSVNVFADFNITTLDCELRETGEAKFFMTKLSLRINEKRKMMRLNLLPEESYSLNNGEKYYEISLNHEATQHNINLDIGSLFLIYTKLPNGTSKNRMGFYSCKII
tara:strand:+ start:506 stop:823 length:318 start_codon:yes stop_codon:yes gene_type:complete